MRLNLHKNGKIQNGLFLSYFRPSPRLTCCSKKGDGIYKCLLGQTTRLQWDPESGLPWAHSTWQIRGVRKRSSVWTVSSNARSRGGGAGTSSFKWRASRDHYVHPCWPEDENSTHLQSLRGLCCSSRPLPSSYSCICFPGSKLFLKQAEGQFPCMWVEQWNRLVCVPSFTFCSQMVIPCQAKSRDGIYKDKATLHFHCAPPCTCVQSKGWLPQNTAPAAMHWLRCLSRTVWPRTKMKDVWVLLPWVTLN